MKVLLKSFTGRLLICAALVIFTARCDKNEQPDAPQEPEEPKPTARFTYKVPDSTKFLSYEFNSTATNFKSLLWQFGDDSTSVEANPKHTYRYPGKYLVRLTSRNGQGYTAAMEINLNIVDPTFDPKKIGENYIRTVGGTYSVNREGTQGPDTREGSNKLIDGDTKTKYLQSEFDGTLRCTYELREPKVVGAYTLTSADDANDRDPRFWIFQASHDGIEYADLHTVTSCPWATTGDRGSTKIFHFDNFVAYKYYRIYFKANRGSRLFQMAEWTINKKQP